MTEQDAKTALRELGIVPTPKLMRNWLRAADAEEAMEYATEMQVLDEPSSANGRGDAWIEGETVAERQSTSSKSRLEPILREQHMLEKTPGQRKPGRPRIVASWFPRVAEAMADGTSLKTALAMNGITTLSKSEIRACYRNTAFKAMYQEARRRYLAEHYGRKPTLRAKIGRYM